MKMNARFSYYKRIIDKWIKNRNARILVVAGRESDSEVFKELGFDNVVISNIDERLKGNEFQPFEWSYQNAENLSFEDNSFDFVVVHASLHHCYSPHRALLEMYRVARQGIVVLESRDSFIMKIATWLGFTQTYEHAAVYYNSCRYGGVQNTHIPNFVYRWTEREIEKTINSYAPFAPHRFRYCYGNDIPCSLAHRKKVNCKMFLVCLLRPFYRLFARIFPKQQNLFACYIEKPNLQKDHFEWLKYEEGKLLFNKDWAEDYYKKA